MPSGKKSLIFKLNAKIYPLETILGTAYSFLDKVYVFLDGDPEKSIKVFLSAKEETPAAVFKKIAGEFRNELINQSLRHRVSVFNKSIREYIVAGAILGAVQNPPEVEGAPVKKKSAKKEENLGLNLEKDKNLLKELKKLEKEFSSGSDFDFKKDEFGIAVPWEEKFGKKKKTK